MSPHIRECLQCGELYCSRCSDTALDPWTYCSLECESEAYAELDESEIGEMTDD